MTIYIVQLVFNFDGKRATSKSYVTGMEWWTSVCENDYRGKGCSSSSSSSTGSFVGTVTKSMH